MSPCLVNLIKKIENLHEHLLVNIESIPIENTRTIGIITTHIYKEDEYLIWSSIISEISVIKLDKLK